MKYCLETVETAAKLETDTELAPWRWYAETYQQFHSLLYCISQAFEDPTIPEADRIVEMANYTFGTTLEGDTVAVCRNFLELIREHFQAFVKARGIAIPKASRESNLSNGGGQTAQDLFGNLESATTPLSWNTFDLEPFAFGANDGADQWWPWPLPEGA